MCFMLINDSDLPLVGVEQTVEPVGHHCAGRAGTKD
jgi:hypothetical protein